MLYLRKYWVCVLALGLSAFSHLGHAALAQVGVRAFASDQPSGIEFTDNSAGSPATGFAVASRSVTTAAGNSSSYAQASANGLSGVVREKLGADVAASQYIIGRNAGASSGASMSGSINLVGPALPGLATFTAVLEGSYDVSTPARFNFPSQFDALPPVSSVPEPESSLLLGLGLILMAATWWRKLIGAGLSITRLRNTANAWTPTAATHTAWSPT